LVSNGKRMTAECPMIDDPTSLILAAASVQRSVESRRDNRAEIVRKVTALLEHRSLLAKRLLRGAVPCYLDPYVRKATPGRSAHDCTVEIVKACRRVHLNRIPRRPMLLVHHPTKEVGDILLVHNCSCATRATISGWKAVLRLLRFHRFTRES
jgi:hypothetical protein